jgi:hypothetical protein
MTRRPSIFAVLTLLVLPAWSWADDSQPSKPAGPASGGQVFNDVRPNADGDVAAFTEMPHYGACDVRFGYWAFWNTGSPAKTGEYQDLSPGAFFDVDQFSSDGIRTFAVTATGSDNLTDKASAYYYENGFTAKVDYDRYIHRLDHDPLNNMADANNPAQAADATQLILKQDLGSGQEYAVRVQEIKASFKSIISDNLKVRLDLWGMEKDGTRQVNTIAMCYSQTTTVPPDHPPVNTFTGSRCHVLSTPQAIDWQTTEIKPVIEARLGGLTIEYSRPMRSFAANDASTSRYYDTTGVLSYGSNISAGPPPVVNTSAYQSAVVPNNYTQMDQVKLSGQLNDENRIYAYLMAGSTVDEEIGETRFFNDMDIRWTNTSIENVSLTGFGTVYNDDEKQPSVTNLPDSLSSTTPLVLSRAGLNANQTLLAAETNRPAYDYEKTTAGLKTVWRPWGTGFGLGGLAITAGYEYDDIQRNTLVYTETSGAALPGLPLSEQRTITNGFQIGPDVRWSPQFDTYLHYKYQNADQPLIGFSRDNGQYNTLLPTDDNIVEVGFTLMPSDHFIVNACVGVEDGKNHTQYANFSEQNYPVNINGWYGLTNRFSVSAGYAIYSNFVGQTITLADQNLPGNVTPAGNGALPSSSIWSYGGQAQVVTLGSQYQASDRVRFTGQFEFVYGHDLISNSATEVNTTKSGSGSPILTTDLGAFSEVQNRTTRLTLGADWTVRPRLVVFGRYELYDFLDQEPGYQSGTAQGVMGGLSAMF